MTSTLLIVQFIFAILIVIAVLLQKSESMGLGGYSGSNESMFGAKGPSGFLVKFTYTIGLAFIINTIALGYLYNQDTQKSIIDNIKTTIPTTNIAPAVPTTNSDKNITK